MNKVGLSKVQLFWEGHKNLHNLPHGFDVYYVTFITTRKIAPIFVAFSEKMNTNGGVYVMASDLSLLILQYD
jgi:hypothetical protein